MPAPPDFEVGRRLRPVAKVLPARARSHNRALVLQTLYHGTGLSRADLARATGLTRVTISDLVAELLDDGLVVEKGPRDEARPGKPAVLLDINHDVAQIIGIDLSEDVVFRGAVLGIDGQVVERAQTALDGAVGEEALGKVLSLVDRLRGRSTRRLLGIGIGTPGVVTPEGLVDSAPNLGWTRLQLQETVTSYTGTRSYVGNDANVAALAEYGFGPADGDMIMVKLGHGVGAGLIVSGSLVWGSRYAAGEIGQITTVGEANGTAKALETVLAVPRLREALSVPGASGDGVLEDAGRRLGEALVPVVGALNPAEVVLSGPEDLVEGVFLAAVLDTLRRQTMNGFHTGVTVRMTRLGADIVLRGAAVLVLSRELGVS
ncbi:MAG TPA: ROK family transcriptional regulator [Microbacteriaceae bacterium]|nr:ROK family transcriptional regulator [Microbacteriaceae bacterium]